MTFSDGALRNISLSLAVLERMSQGTVMTRLYATQLTSRDKNPRKSAIG